MEKRGMIELEYAGGRVQLRTCPFCGSDPVIRSHKRYGTWYNIKCSDDHEVCRMRPMTMQYRDLKQAAADWNMTPPEPNDPLTLDELREMDGEPVWVKSINDDALFATRGWAIVTVLDNGDISLGFLGEDSYWITLVLSESAIEGTDEEDEVEAVYRRRPEAESHTQTEPAVPGWAEHLNSRFLRME